MSHNYPYRVPPPHTDVRPDRGANGPSDSRRPSGNGSHAPPPYSSSASAVPQENVMSLLSSCGLEPEDLARLAELPEDVLTVESLPHILHQMKGKKGVVKPHPSTSASSSSFHSSSTSRPAINWEQLRSQPVQYPLISSTRLPPEQGQEHWGMSRTSSSVQTDPPLPSSSSSGYMLDVDVRAGPSKYGKTDPVPAFSPVGQRLDSSHFSDYGPTDRQAPYHRPTPPPPPLPQHVTNKYGGRHQKSESSSSRSSQPPSSTPSMKQALDFHGTTPSVFPYACSLCDITVLSEKVWTQHINSKLHADGQLNLLQEFPKWDCRVKTVNRDEGQSQSREKKGNPAPAACAANQSRAATQSSRNSQKKAKGKVVCVKFPPQTVDETYLRKLTEPFGKIVKILMFPSLAFVELGSVDQANDLVKFHVNYPPTVNGSQIDFSISSTFSFLQSSQVVSFTPAPAGEDGRSDLISIVKRFGVPLYTLFLPSRAYVEMKTVAEAQKLVDYYSSNVLRISDDSIRVSFAGEYKSLARISSAKRYEESPAPKSTKRIRTRSRSRSRGKSTRTRSRSRDKKARTRSKSREKCEKEQGNGTRSKSAEKSNIERRTRTRSRSRDKSNTKTRTRTRSRSRDKKARTRSKSREKCEKEQGNGTRSKSAEKFNIGRRTRTRSRSRDKSNTETRTRTRSRSRDKSNREKQISSRSRSRSQDDSRETPTSNQKTRSRSRSKDSSSREKRTRSRSKSRSKDKTSGPANTETRSGPKETSEEPKKPAGDPAPVEQSEPEAADTALMNDEGDDDDEEDDEGLSVDDSDIEGMEVIAEDGEEVEDEDAEEEEEEEEEEEHNPAVKTQSSEHGEEEEEEVKKEEDVKEEEEDVKEEEEEAKKEEKAKKLEDAKKEEEVKEEEEAKKEDEEEAKEEEEVKEEEEEAKKEEEEAKREEESKEEKKPDAQEETEAEENKGDPQEESEEDEAFPVDPESFITLDELGEDECGESGEEAAVVRQSEPDSSRVVYIRNLPPRFYSDAEFLDVLRGCGTAVRYLLIRSRQEGFVEMSTPSEAARAARELNSRPVLLNKSKLDFIVSRKYYRLTSGWTVKPEADGDGRSSRRSRRRRDASRKSPERETRREPAGRKNPEKLRNILEDESASRETSDLKESSEETQQRTGGLEETPHQNDGREDETQPRAESPRDEMTKTPEKEEGPQVNMAPEEDMGGSGGTEAPPPPPPPPGDESAPPADPRSAEKPPEGEEKDQTLPDGLMKDGEVKSADAEREEDSGAARTPSKPVGVEFVRPVVGYFCNLCQLIYADEDEAKQEHCRTPEHYRRYQEKTGKDPWTS